MANETAVASGAASGIDAEQRVKAAVPDAYIYACAQHGYDLLSNELSMNEFFAHGKTPKDAWDAGTRTTAVLAYERTHNPSLQSPEAPIRTGLEGERASMIKIVNVTEDELWGRLQSFLDSMRSGVCGEKNPEGLDEAQFSVMALRPKSPAPESAVPAKDGFDSIERYKVVRTFPNGSVMAVDAYEFDRLLSAHRKLQREQALAASAPEGKVTWRVEWLHDDGLTWIPCQPLQFDEETARIQILGEERFRLIKIEETVVETRTRKEQ
jgi:hypothetical protein